MQARACWGALLPQLPGGEEIEPGTKAGFADGEDVAFLQICPAFLQVVLAKEYVPGFFEAGCSGKVDVVEGAGNRLAVFPPFDGCVRCGAAVALV